MSTTTVTEDHVFHRDIEGQANTWFGHRLDWSRYCTFCASDAVQER